MTYITETAWIWKSLFIGITCSARTSSLLRSDIEHALNFPKRDAVNLWLTKASEFQILADSNDSKGFYQSMKSVLGPTESNPEQMLALNNKTMIREKHNLLAR